MKKQIVVMLALAALLCTTATGLINPNFTLSNIYEQADQILVLEFTEVKDGKMTAKVTKVLKGDEEEAPKTVTLDVMGGLGEYQKTAGEGVLNVVKAGYKTGVLFVGEFMIVSADGYAEDPMPRALLNLGHPPFSKFQWAMFLNEEGSFTMERQPGPELLATFAGSTDMVIKAIEYIRDDPAADLPVTEGVVWAKESKVGKVDGEVVSVMGVDMAGEGKLDVFVAATGGDKLFRFNGKGFDDVSEKLGLASKSQYVAWGDYNGDGRLDLASWNGKEVVIYAGQADGKLTALPVTSGETIKDCLGLAAVGGADGKSVLVVSTKEAAVLVTVGEKMTASALATGEVKDFAAPGACLVADLDGDGQVDILRPFERGAIMYKGTAAGKFAEPAAVDAARGPGIYAGCLGDFDHDGLLDVFFTAADRTRLYQNNGGGKFSERIGLSGEIPYISKPEGNDCSTGDFNGDGRQDILIGYRSMGPQLFFNRGFRSFGHAREVDLSMQGQLPKSHQGQAAVTLGDFNGSGAIDMVVALKDGEIYLVPREVSGVARAVTVVLDEKALGAGTVTVKAKHFDHSLGAMVVRSGRPATFCVTLPGLVTLSWQLPDGKEQTKAVKVENKPVTVKIGK